MYLIAREDKMSRYAAFDLEIAKLLPENATNLMAHRPLGITCAAVMFGAGTNQPTVWYGKTTSGDIAGKMSRKEAQDIVGFLQALIEQGWTLLTWNGLGFDFDVLAEESGLLNECRTLAQSHVDMMFHFFCVQGYALSLDKAARGMRLAGKTAGMSGALAPKMWSEGKHREVIDYLEQDVRTTLALAEAVDQHGELRWTSQRGSPMQVRLPQGWLRVQDAMSLPLPDTSWMSRPWPRSRFTGWLQD
jgi:hypothetical protein